MLNKYLASLKEQLENQEIYTTQYYIVVSFNREEIVNISNIDSCIKKLNSIGCFTQRLNTKIDIENLLYESINKEVTA